MRFMYLPARRGWHIVCMTVALVLICVAAVALYPDEEGQTAGVSENLREFIKTGGDKSCGQVGLLFFVDEYVQAEDVSAVLVTLTKKEKTASFMLTGSFMEKNRELVASISSAGHELGILGWSSAAAVNLGAGECVNEFKKAQTLLIDITGKPVRLYSPPFAVVNDNVIEAAQSCQLTVIMPASAAAAWQSEKDATLLKRAANSKGGDWYALYVNPQCVALLSEIVDQFKYADLGVGPVGAQL